MKKEYVFIISLAVIAIILFGFGSRAGLALQATLRGIPSPAAADTEAAVLSATSINGVPGRTVPVYSQYPFNLKNELTIAAGSVDGITIGDAAVTDGFLVGVVSRVFERSALVQTVFDSRFQMPVRIGDAAADALLRGGVNPALTLIAAGADVGEGDEVRSAASGMPYGLSLGNLRGLHDSGDSVFREAALQAHYNPGDLRLLTIIPYSGR